MSEDGAPPATDEATLRTLGHYGANAESFWAGTRDHDVTQNYAALLDALGGTAPLRLLDFGCGPGRDLVALGARGQVVTGLDGTAKFVEMARELSGSTVLHQNFLELDLGEQRFDGVFANASLFHVPAHTWRACSESCLPRSCPAAFCSARTRARSRAIARGSTESATVRT